MTNKSASSPGQLKLLPIRFKRYAIFLLLGSIAFAVLAATQVIPIDKEVAKSLALTGIFSSLLMIALTRDKAEDERSQYLRLVSFASAFIFGVVFLIVDQIFQVIWPGGESFLKPALLLGEMFFWYFVTYFFFKLNS